MKVWCYSEKGIQICGHIGEYGPPDPVIKEIRKVAAHYLEAAEKYPDDEERHVCAWNLSLMSLRDITTVFCCFLREWTQSNVDMRCLCHANDSQSDQTYTMHHYTEDAKSLGRF